MAIRTLLIIILGGILSWDYITSEPSESTLARAGAAAQMAYSQVAVQVKDVVHDYQVRQRLQRAAEEREEAINEMMVIEEAAMNDVARDNISLEEVPILPAPHAPMVTDFGDSVFSRAAIDSFIAEASELTDIPEGYLAHLAERESAFDPVAAAGTSSAKGLYQFTESTWLEVFARYGAQHGQEDLAKNISIASNGRPSVADARIKRRILNLRYDPKLSTFMAAHYAKEQRVFLMRRLDRAPTEAELYIAHFLGANGASKLFIAFEESPKASAVELFPAAARANRRFFYDRKGNAVDIATLHANLMSLCAPLLPVI